MTDVLRKAIRWCPVHHMPDCSPLLNGCSLPNQQHDALDEIESLLKRLRQWDVMQSTADGPYWISEINKILEDTDDPDRP